MERWRKIVVVNGAKTEMLCDDVISNLGKTIVVVVVVHDFDEDDDSEEHHH